ncbi:hypothetical protein QTI66_06455 [Variovorax sp. J22R133]|uniref:hypothetical protein n=1 Tax=Variovorax brevis TaxID=3053503 RepID=UPI002575E570|nr:hypothetical protein [Variovorax sp. J22R133]MDM0111784.1 hypothetical protein [Variovorax sp. J22R133]
MSIIQKIVRTAAALGTVIVLAGCAHPIAINSDAGPERVDSKLIQKKVAYALSDTERAKQVITAGGGGDKISYYPYRDLEKSIRDALRSVYQDVVVVKTAADVNAVKASGATLVFTPEIKTSSSSPSAFTWPPTEFTTDISCTVTDAGGVEVTRVKATGNGKAEFDEFKSDFALSAKRSSADMSVKLSEEIRNNVRLR